MKCKQHHYERGAGVCASCLRDRLLALIDAQNDLAAAAADHNYHRRRGSEPPPPPPLQFPRSVSPYRRRSDASLPHRRHINRFFSTPQVGPASAATAGDDFAVAGGGRRRFSLFASLFGPRRGSEADRPDSWLSSLIRRPRKKKSQVVDPEERPAWRDRGMSPARYAGDDGSSACSSEYMTESSPAWWRRPGPTTPMRRAAAAARGGMSGFAVCLSPLVRASPGGDRRRGGTAEVGLSGDLWAPPSTSQPRRRCSGGGAALGPNRSRKLADLGRFK